MAKTKLPEAKKIKATLDALPDAVFGHLYNTRYNRSSMTPSVIANLLVDKEGDDCGNSCGRKELESFEADVVLQAHDCTTMSQLCKKLGI